MVPAASRYSQYPRPGINWGGAALGSTGSAVPPALTQDQVEQCRRMADEGSGLRHIARVMTCSPATVKKALAGPPTGDMSTGSKMARMRGEKPI